MPAPITTGNSIFIPTGPAPDYTQFLADDPFYKQDLDWIKKQQELDLARAVQDRGFDQRAYDLNVLQAKTSADSGGDYGVATATAQTALAKEKAAHDNANRAEYLREWLGSRGMLDSGQNAWEQNERGYQFDIYNRGLDTDLQGRISSANDARAAAQANLSIRLQELQLGREQGDLNYNRYVEDTNNAAARASGSAAFALYQRLQDSGKLNAPGENAMWDEVSQMYVTADGRYWKVGPDGKPYVASWTGQSGGGSPGVAPAPYTPYTPEYYESAGPSRPVTNVIPGAAWGYE